MDPCKTVISVLQRGGSLLVLTGFLGTSAFAAPIPLPDWVKPIEAALPKLPPDVISEVDEIITFNIGNSYDSRFRPEVKAQIEGNNQRLVELREQADQAMIWQYLKATSELYPGYQYNYLSRLGHDRGLAAWLLPIVRFRIEWLKKALHDPTQKQHIHYVFSCSEIYDIEQYFFQQGEFSDIENLNFAEDKATELLFRGKLVWGVGHQRLQEQVKAMQEARIQSHQHDCPFWKSRAVSLIAQGVLSADALKPRPPAQNPGDGSYRPKPLGPRKPLPVIKVFPGFLQPWMMWPMWLIIFAVSAGLLRWVFRKPKRASEDGEPNVL